MDMVKKAYRPPQIVTYGDIRQITRGGFVGDAYDGAILYTYGRSGGTTGKLPLVS